MSPFTTLYTYNGLILKTLENFLAAGPNCCCGESCCCLDFANVNFSFTIDCGDGNETFTGTMDGFGGFGTDIETGQWSISVGCTAGNFPCDGEGDFIGYQIGLIRFDPFCYGTAKYACSGSIESFSYLPCPSSPKADFTTDIIKDTNAAICEIIGTITFTPPPP